MMGDLWTALIKMAMTLASGRILKKTTLTLMRVTMTYCKVMENRKMCAGSMFHYVTCISGRNGNQGKYCDAKKDYIFYGYVIYSVHVRTNN